MMERACPLCGESRSEALLDLEAEDFCKVNLTYSKDFRKLLNLGSPAHFPIRQCTACDFVYAGQVPEQGFLETLYDRVIQRDQCVDGSENSPSYARRLRYVATLIDLAATTSPALDYGSGLGVTLRILRSCGIDAIGFDPSAVRRNYSNDANLEVTADRAKVRERAPYRIVIFDNVLEHVPDPTEVMTFLKSVSSPGTIAYVSVPSYERPFLESQIKAAKNGARVDMTLNPWEHLSYFSAASLDRLMERAGFRRIPDRELPAPNIGLRAEGQRVARLKNAAASIPRLVRYAVSGRGIANIESAFYRRR